jgi:hypothetical protein
MAIFEVIKIHPPLKKLIVLFPFSLLPAGPDSRFQVGFKHKNQGDTTWWRVGAKLRQLSVRRLLREGSAC